MKCQHCGGEIGMEEAVPKAIIRKMISEQIDLAETAEDKLRGIDLLSKLEGYTGPGLKRDPKKVGVFIVQESTMRKGPGKNVEGELPKPT